MNNTTVINVFKSDISNIAYTNNKHCQIMTTIAYIILKFESMIKEPIAANHAFFTSIIFSKINSFTYINYRNTTLYNVSSSKRFSSK